MTRSFPLIEVEGPPLERGRAYGRQAGDRIARGLRLYASSLTSPRLSEIAARYLARLAEFDRGLAAEVRGIAEGAEQPVEAIVALNARTELTAWDAKAVREGCTAALAMPRRTADGSLLHGQNWDWRPDCAETSIVLRILVDNGPDILTFCEAGQLARHGINSVGLAVTANGLQTDHEGSADGLPSPFARRRILMSQTLAEASDVILNTPRSASHNLMLSQIDGSGRAAAINFETTPEQLFWSFPTDGLLTHANHFKHPVALLSVKDIGLLRHPESLLRDSRAYERLDAGRASITVDTLKQVFADDFGEPHSICRPPAVRPDGSLSATVASLIMNAGSGDIWIAPSPFDGVPSYTRYKVAA